MNTINRKVSDEFSKGNFEFAFPYFADDIQWHIVGSPAIRTKEAVEAYCRKMQGEMEGSTLNNISSIEGTDCVAVQGYCNYTTEDKALGKVAYCDVYRFAGEKLQEITSYCIELKRE